eukprot:6378715-Karenia_brevis.AAC.1
MDCSKWQSQKAGGTMPGEEPTITKDLEGCSRQLHTSLHEDPGWPVPDNNPTIGVQLDYQTIPQIDTTLAEKVWLHGPVSSTPPPPPLGLSMYQEPMTPVQLTHSPHGA